MDEFPKELRDYIIKHLRRIGYRNIHYKKAMASAHKGFGEWQCSKCGAIGTRKDLHGDHIDPVISPTEGFVDWNTYLERLFLGAIQSLCKPCHVAKSKAENEIRREQRHRYKSLKPDNTESDDWTDV